MSAADLGRARHATNEALDELQEPGRLPAEIARRGYIVREASGDVHATWSASNPDRPERQPSKEALWAGGSPGWRAWGNDYSLPEAEALARRWLHRMKRSGYRRAWVEIADLYADGSEKEYRWQGGAGELEELTDEEKREQSGG